MKVSFYTLGCKVNQYESRAMSEMLEKNGFEIVPSGEKADVFVVNSCTVTAQADQKTRQAVRKFKRKCPESVVVLTGCMPQAFPADAERLFEADIVTGNKTPGALLTLLDEFFKNGKRVVSIEKHENGEKFAVAPITAFDERTRAYLKIQDGCNRFCSYCIIPFSRGRVRSKPLETIRSEVHSLAGNGFKEIVLVGINLSSFGQDNGSSFPEAVETAASVEGIERIRLGSLEPDHLTDEVIERLSKVEKLCPQFHLSLQSGCDRTLRAMNRHYTAGEFFELTQKLRAKFDGCAITTDVMVGFCGETEADFEESLDFVRKVGFEKVHVFPFSVRKGTRAESFDDQVSKAEKSLRAGIMIEESEKIRQSFFESLRGKTLEVLFETKQTDGSFIGHSRNYAPVKVKSDCDVSGKILNVRVIEPGEGDFVIGEIG